MEPRIIEGPAKDVIAWLVRTLADTPGDEPVRVTIGRPGLAAIARKLQAVARGNGMTDDIHDELLQSLKNDR